MATKQTTEHLELEVVSLLVQAADTDTVYRDLYLERASLRLAKLFPERSIASSARARHASTPWCTRYRRPCAGKLGRR
jgi:hypothetical protein